MQKIVYKVQELDCAEEVAILKKALSDQRGIIKLDFNILSSQLQVFYDPSLIDSEKILSLIHSTGMKAFLLSEKIKQPAHTFWFQHGRLIMTTVSGLCLLCGVIFHYLTARSLIAIFGFEDISTDRTTPQSAIIFYLLAMISGAWFVIPRAWSSLRKFLPDMNLLMIIAVIGAAVIHQWFEGATVTFLFSLALLLQHWSVERARKAISTLLDLSPPLARVIENEHFVEKKVEEVSIGEHILIRPGEKFPLDGVVTKGSSSANQASITGESMPVAKHIGDNVFAGTLNEEGALECKVTKKFSDTTLARIIHMIEEAQSKRAQSEQWVEKFAHFYTPLMIILALGIALIPPLFFNLLWIDWIYRGLVLLVIACPCALVISTPVSIVSGLTAAARSGALIKGGIYLESIGSLRALALDKTGTITYGHPIVQKIIALNDHTESDLLQIASSLERQSEHPLARAILKKAHDNKIKHRNVEQFKIIKGLGAEAKLDGKAFWIGSHRMMHDKGQETEEIHNLALALEDAGHSVIVIGNEDHVCGLISIADEARKYVSETIQVIRDLGVKKIVMLTGDNFPTASALAELIGIKEFYAELLPEDKVKIVEELKAKYQKVAMVGDGVNDAPALATANIGIAMGAMGTDAAFETADIVLMSDDLSLIPRLIRHSRKTVRIIQQNIFFSLGLKAIFLVLTLFGLATLWMAIAADTGASLLVVFNALRLLRS